ncbi:hypothetical protein G6F65_021202 [Rhizopus arrhizus]|nr:hypothetical protein G6F65_021202 [Rhizopus arrhizus]
MHRVQRPEPAETVLGTVIDVVHRVEQQQVDDQADPGLVRHAGPVLVQLERRKAPDVQLSEDAVPERVDREEQRQAEHAQAVDQRVQHVDADLAAVGDRFNRPQTLQGAEHQHQHGDLHQAHQQPHGGVVAVFDEVAHPQVKQRRLDQRFEEPLLAGPEELTKRIHDQ